MRILYIDYFTDNMNPVCRQWPLLLKHVGDVDFFGPGFLPMDKVKAGLKKYIKNNGSYDFIICAENFYLRNVMDWPLKFLANAYTKQYLLPFDITDAIQTSKGIVDEFLDIDGNRLLTTLMLDNYNCYPELSKFLRQFDGHLISLGLPFIQKKSKLPYLQEEIFCEWVTDVWFELVDECKSKIISMPFFVMEDEFSLVELGARKIPWSVVGAKYSARKKARDVLSDAGIQWGPRSLNMLVAAWARISKVVPVRKFELSVINHLFRQSIETSQFSYTCGSGYQMPIRKFFEIPALGSVLVCRPCNGFESLGFIDGVNALVAEPTSLPDVHRDLIQDMDKAQSIATAGQKLIWEKHTATARARQLKRSLESIQRKQFAGSEWEQGRYSSRERL